MKEPLKIGLVGLDTSHVIVFSKCFNKPDARRSCRGRARRRRLSRAGRDDFELSRSRVEKFTEQVRDEFGVKIVGFARGGRGGMRPALHHRRRRADAS